MRPTRILQFGEGNFLRAFFDWMIDVANEQGVTDCSVAIVSPRFAAGRAMQALKEQHGRYHVVLEGIADGQPVSTVREITCVSDVLAPSVPADMERYKLIVVSPELRFVVSNTTEAGIRYEHDDIMSDAPATFPGKIASLLWQRWQAFGGDPDRGLIFLCCELIEDNGSTLRGIVLRHAKEAGLPKEFIGWVEECNIFADTLVDRIVPGFPTDSYDEVRTRLGADDQAVVKAELYHLWAISGKDYARVAEELPLDRAGLHVMFMPDIKPFRDKKVRILNGAHTIMVPLALSVGCETVMDAFGNADINGFIRTMIEWEVLPMIDGDRSELQTFADGILERFYNPFIRHYIKSIALNSLSKWETRCWPTVKDLWQKRCVLSGHMLYGLAALLHLYGPENRFEPQDDPGHIKLIREAWDANNYPATVRRILEGGIFNAKFADEVPGLTERLAEYLAEIHKNGILDS